MSTFEVRKTLAEAGFPARARRGSGRGNVAYDVRPSAVLYVICDGAGRLKVGFTSQLQVRLRQLQTGSPRLLSVYATEPVDGLDPGGVEGVAHQLLAEYRERGEWFNCHPEEALAAIRHAAFMAE